MVESDLASVKKEYNKKEHFEARKQTFASYLYYYFHKLHRHIKGIILLSTADNRRNSS